MTNRRKILSSLTLILSAAAVIFFSVRAQSTPEELAEARLFDRASTAIEKNYIDPARVVPRKMLSSALAQIQRTLPEVLVRGADTGDMAVEVGLAKRRFKSEPMGQVSDLRRVMKEVLSFIAANYDGETEHEEIEYAAIDGMLGALDPHSNFMSPKAYKEFEVGTRGKFGGLGIVISIKDGQLTVIAPMEGTPAAAAGIRAGDRIVQIDDESTINMSLNDAVNKLRGDVGAKVTIVTERSGKPARRITLARAVINIDSVQSKLLSEGDKRIGYIKVKNFQQNTDDDVRKALASFHEGNAKLDGIILDLRNNPGGLLNIAIDLADRFLAEGTIVTTVGAHGQVLERESARPSAGKETAPLVVLVNEGSASASEIVAGALKAAGRAVVMGRRTFGKGSVQTLFELGGGSALKLTIAQYKPAGTISIQLAGLAPDVDLMPVTVDAKGMNLVEDVVPSEGDLDEHLEGSQGAKPVPLPSSEHRVRYLMPREEESELEARSVKEYSKDPDVEKDFAVTMARRFLSASSGKAREEMLRSGAGALAAADAEQASAMEAALKAAGIDWRGAKAEGEPKLKLTYRLKSPKGEVSQARAGDKVELELSATNVGTGAYSRLIAVGQSEYYFLSNLEFPFGLLAAGQTRKWSVPIEIPEAMPRGDLLLDISFEEENRRLPQPLTAILPVEELPPPSFGFSYSIAPSGRPYPVGAPVSLNMQVVNNGPGASGAETAATLSNDCGEKLFIERGRTKLGAMAPRAARNTSFRFHLAASPSDGVCPMKLAIADMKRLHILSKKLELKTKEGAILPEPGKRYSPPVIELSAPRQTADASVKISGRITDTDKVRDYFVFVGDKKIAYVPNPGDASSMPFEATVPLEPGNNTVVIGARDDTLLMSRKVVIVHRTSGERKKEHRFRDAGLLPDIGK